MAAAKRPASNSFGSSQMVVKRQKSDTDINGKDLAVTSGSKSANGSLIQAVSLSPSPLFSTHLPSVPLPLTERVLNESLKQRRPADGKGVRVGATHKWPTSPHHGAHRYVKIPPTCIVLPLPYSTIPETPPPSIPSLCPFPDEKEDTPH